MSTSTPPSPSKDAHTLPLPATTPGSQAPSTTDPPVIRLARHLLVILTAVCTFGAGVAFEALQSGGSTGRGFLAWAFAAFAIGIVTTLIWQAALVADFRTFTGRMYRSHTGILAALIVGASSAIVGTLLLSLSITRHEDLSVHAAGYTVLSSIGLLVGGSSFRLLSTAIHRRAIYIRKCKEQYDLRVKSHRDICRLDYLCDLAPTSPPSPKTDAVDRPKKLIPVRGTPSPMVDKVLEKIEEVEFEPKGPGKPSDITEGPDLCAPDVASTRSDEDVECLDAETAVESATSPPTVLSHSTEHEA